MTSRADPSGPKIANWDTSYNLRVVLIRVENLRRVAFDVRDSDDVFNRRLYRVTNDT